MRPLLRTETEKAAIIDLQLNETIGPWHPDASGSKAHAIAIGGVKVETIK